MYPLSIHIVASPVQPKESPNTHVASEFCFLRLIEHFVVWCTGGSVDTVPAEQFMMGVVTTSGEAEIAHMENCQMHPRQQLSNILRLCWSLPV